MISCFAISENAKSLVFFLDQDLLPEEKERLKQALTEELGLPCVIVAPTDPPWRESQWSASAKYTQENLDNPSEMLHEKTQNESYKRYKHLCYRNLILEALLALALGLFAAAVFKF